MKSTKPLTVGSLILFAVLILVGMAMNLKGVEAAFTTTSTSTTVKYRHVSTDNSPKHFGCQHVHSSSFKSRQEKDSDVYNASASRVVLSSSPNIDGTGRGAIIQGLVLLLCVWIFSIPPEFRRTHMCMSDYCEQNRSACYDCLTSSEWRGRIADYYRGGGGIQFDFTIGDETKELFGN